jgi:hyperosmotically inducible protein
MKATKSTVLICLFVILTLAACQTPAGRSAGGVIDDGAISSKVKAKLFDDATLSGFAIDVDTFQGEVTLSGAVDSSADKSRAEDIAKSVQGVTKVNNLLKIQ